MERSLVEKKYDMYLFSLEGDRPKNNMEDKLMKDKLEVERMVRRLFYLRERDNKT